MKKESVSLIGLDNKTIIQTLESKYNILLDEAHLHPFAKRQIIIDGVSFDRFALKRLLKSLKS